MGGTTAKAGSIIEFRPLLVPEFEVGGRIIGGRTVKGSGYPVRTASIDLAEVSGGGGTIVSVDAGGSLRVGPVSAGAEPGPACYGKGGREPTITDANLILGRIGTGLLGGELRLDARAARASFERIAEGARLEPFQVAAAAIGVVNLQMAKAIQIVSLERGLDPREFTLIAFGGAGPMHAAELAEEVGIRAVVIPPMPGLFSALGMVLSESRYDEMKGMVADLDHISAERIEREFESLEGSLRRRLSERGIRAEGGTVRRSMDLRYRGQGYELQVDVRGGLSKKEVIRRFERKHRAIYGFLHDGKSVEVTALRTALLIPGRKVGLQAIQVHSEGEPLKGRRRAWLSGAWVETPVYRRETLRPQTIEGPAILESYDSTVVIPRRWKGRVDDLGCLRMERGGS
jgi:N-methylhydantoinase A